MELWFTEKQSKHAHFDVRIKNQILSIESEYQSIDLFETMRYGKMLVIDGKIVLTQRDEFIYNEMLVHPSFSVCPSIEKVLVLGLSSGGVISELLKHPTVSTIDIVELDDMLVDVIKNNFNDVKKSLKSDKVSIKHVDPLAYLRKVSDTYDLILVNVTDSSGPNEVLFTKEFYGACDQALSKDGIVITQQDSFEFGHKKALKRNVQNIQAYFPITAFYLGHIPTFPAGQWLFTFASKTIKPLDAVNELDIQTKYYDQSIHHAAFALPKYMKGELDYEPTNL